MVRLASPEDIVARMRHRQREEEAYRIALLKIRERGLSMKLTRVEQAFDGSRLLFYFTADARVDFRELVRELATEFRTRIEMRQIGVRDEARVLGGYGTCGRPLCCTTLPHEFRAGLDQDGEAAGPEPQPVEALRTVRPAQMLSALRAAERQGAGARRLRQRGWVRQPLGCGTGSCGTGTCGCRR
ncbi:MAG: PSP1 domain-containing protein [Chitinophagaceae bacterium]